MITMPPYVEPVTCAGCRKFLTAARGPYTEYNGQPYCYWCGDDIAKAAARDLTYEAYREEVGNIANFLRSLNRQGRESKAELVAAEYNALEAAYPAHAGRLAAELCTQESQEREWEL